MWKPWFKLNASPQRLSSQNYKCDLDNKWSSKFARLFIIFYLLLSGLGLALSYWHILKNNKCYIQELQNLSIIVFF